MDTNLRVSALSKVFVATQLAALSSIGLAAGYTNFQANAVFKGLAWVAGIIVLIVAVIALDLPNRIAKIPSAKVIVFITLTTSIVSLVLAYWHASFYFDLPPGLEDLAGARNLRSVATIGLIGYGSAFLVNTVYLLLSRRHLFIDVDEG